MTENKSAFTSLVFICMCNTYLLHYDVIFNGGWTAKWLGGKTLQYYKQFLAGLNFL